MTTSPVQWNPESNLIKQPTQFAQKRGQTPEAIITEAVLSYIQIPTSAEAVDDNDLLIGLYSGSPNLSTV